MLFPVLALAAGLVAPGRSAAQAGGAAGGDLVSLARAYTAAWSAHDWRLPLACFAPDAVICTRGLTCRTGSGRPLVWRLARWTGGTGKT